MADNIKGIPFSSKDEGVNFPQQAINAVARSQWETFEEAYSELGRAVNLYVVSFTYVLGNWKAMVSTDIPDGRYYEVTSRAQGPVFVDVYTKTANIEMTQEDLL